MQRVQRGDMTALGILFHRYSRRVLRVAMRIVRDRREAEDLLQEVFLYILRKRCTFDDSRGTVATWVLQVAYSRSLNRRKRLQGSSTAYPVQNDAINCFADPEITTERMIESLSAERIVHRGLTALPEHQRETLWLHFHDGYTLREISARRKESLGNTRHHFYRGMAALRSLIESDEAREERKRDTGPRAAA